MRPKRTRFPRVARAEQLRTRGAAAQFGAGVRRERERRRISQDTAASAAGIWQTALSRLERGHVTGVRFETILRLLDHCGLAIDLVPKDEAVARYRAERAAAEERRHARQLDLLEEARAELQREFGQRRAARRSA